MTTRDDTFTATVDAAAAFERLHGADAPDPRDEKPTLAEAERDEAWVRGERGAW